MKLRRRGFLAAMLMGLVFPRPKLQAGPIDLERLATITITPIYGGAPGYGWTRIGTLTKTVHKDGRRTMVYRPLDEHRDIEVRMHGERDEPRPAKLVSVTIEE